MVHRHIYFAQLASFLHFTLAKRTTKALLTDRATGQYILVQVMVYYAYTLNFEFGRIITDQVLRSKVFPPCKYKLVNAKHQTTQT